MIILLLMCYKFEKIYFEKSIFINIPVFLRIFDELQDWLQFFMPYTKKNYFP